VTREEIVRFLTQMIVIHDEERAVEAIADKWVADAAAQYLAGATHKDWDRKENS
jgi:hypothetical protein